MSVVDLSFVDRIDDRTAAIRDRRERYRESLLEGIRQKLKHMHDDAEGVQGYARHLIRANADISEELNEMETFGHSLLLVVGLLKREAGRN